MTWFLGTRSPGEWVLHRNQSVGQWIRGERHSESASPPPYVLIDGGLWLWGEVATALADRGEEIDEIGYPDRQDIQVISGVLAAKAIAAEVGPQLLRARAMKRIANANEEIMSTSKKNLTD